MNPQEPKPVTLESWKEIAAYLQRDAKTARRWEKEEGLPVHRHNHRSRSSVYAYPAEIDAWRASRKTAPEAAPVKPVWRVPAFALTVLLCLVLAGSGIRTEAASAQQRPTAKRVLANKDIQDYNFDSISPGGEWLGGTDWNQGDLILMQVSSGETRRLVVAADKDNNRWGETPLISPDQKQVAYWWFDSADPKAHGQLRVRPNQPGAKSRVLIDTSGEYGNGAYPIGWSPDGKRILAKLDKLDENRRRGRDIGWVSAADSSVQVIKTLEPWNAGGGVTLRLSPDGRFVAYSAKIQQNAPETAIYLLSADGSAQTELVRGGMNVDPVWTPDGSHILFSSNRSGASGLWSVAVRNGKKEGLPALVKADIGRIRATGITRTGRFFYNYFDDLDQVFVAEMDPATGQARGPATESFVGGVPAWSRDGKWLAFKRQRAGAANATNSTYELILHSMEKGTDWMPPNPMGNFRPRWYLNGSVQPTIGPRRVSVDGGQPKETTAPIPLPSMGQLSPDDKLLYGRVDRGTEAIEVIDVATGARKQMFPVPGGVTLLAVSPDGKTLAIVSMTAGTLHLSRIDVDGSNYRELVSGVTNGQPAWTRDGRSILFVQPDGKDSTVGRMMRIPADGGQPEFAGISAQHLQDLDLSPDGSKIAYSSSSFHDEVWALDNVLSALK